MGAGVSSEQALGPWPLRPPPPGPGAQGAGRGVGESALDLEIGWVG